MKMRFPSTLDTGILVFSVTRLWRNMTVVNNFVVNNHNLKTFHVLLLDHVQFALISGNCLHSLKMASELTKDFVLFLERGQDCRLPKLFFHWHFFRRNILKQTYC